MVTALLHKGVADADQRVIIAHPDAEALTGEYAEIAYRRMLATSFGNNGYGYGGYGGYGGLGGYGGGWGGNVLSYGYGYGGYGGTYGGYGAYRHWGACGASKRNAAKTAWLAFNVRNPCEGVPHY